MRINYQSEFRLNEQYIDQGTTVIMTFVQVTNQNKQAGQISDNFDFTGYDFCLYSVFRPECFFELNFFDNILFGNQIWELTFY